MNINIITTEGVFYVIGWVGTLATLWSAITSNTPVSCHTDVDSVDRDHLFNQTQVVHLVDVT